MSPLDPQSPTLDPERAWTLVVSLRERLRERGPLLRTTGVCLDRDQTLREVEPGAAWIDVGPHAERGWSWADRGLAAAADHAPALARLFDLYVPLCVGPEAQTMVVAHLAQSLDGRIATHNGVSQFISGHEDLVHTHRLRALFDAVVVGASTVEHDDPRLTTRLCSGSDPVRVIIDPRSRVGADRRVLREGPAHTLLVRREGTPPATPTARHVEVVTLPAPDGPWLPVAAILQALRARGLRRVFIEGGGVTVSRFLQAGLIDRLQVSISPVIIGSGRPGFTLPVAVDLEAALKLDARCFEVGRDVLFDCRLATAARSHADPR